MLHESQQQPWFRLMSILVLLCSLICGSATALASPILHYGDRTNDVLFLQQTLNRLGYNVGTIDGHFGSDTLTAVEQFQADNQLSADGLVGTRTWNALRFATPQANRGYSRSAAETIVAFAKRFIGVPYVFGGNSPSGFDCSGFTQYVFAHSGIDLPRTADLQFDIGVPVNQKNLQPGDLVFFSTYEPGASHSGIYIDSGNFINATSSRGIAISSLYSSYWSARYMGARRIVR